MRFGASASIVFGGLGDVVHGTDFVLGTVNAGALRRVVDDIDEVGEIFGVDGDCNLLGFYRANSKTALAQSEKNDYLCSRFGLALFFAK